MDQSTVKQAIEKSNHGLRKDHKNDFRELTWRLRRQQWNTKELLEGLASLAVAVPSWALGAGGTRFGRFRQEGEPRNVFEKLDDIAVVHQLTGTTRRVSLHIPWDEPEDIEALREHGDALGLGFDAVNSNTFQDQPGQRHSYKFGGLSHVDISVRAQAIEHHRHVIQVGQKLGSTALTVWPADGTNYPGQANMRKSFFLMQDSLEEIYKHLPDDWDLYLEHKPFEPAFYSTVVQDWGSSFILAQSLGDRASCLVDLGHHLPGTNIEQIVARLIQVDKLGGFHFNDAKYGDDDLTTGSIHPYQLFLVFNELMDAALQEGASFNPAFMLDQSHNVKDPIEALVVSVDNLHQAFAKALLVDREALSGYQDENDVTMAERTLMEAFCTDVRPLIAEVRRRKDAAIDPIQAFRASGYRAQVAAARGTSDYRPPQSL